jgi:hypothetical protein
VAGRSVFPAVLGFAEGADFPAGVADLEVVVTEFSKELTEKRKIAFMGIRHPELVDGKPELMGSLVMPSSFSAFIIYGTPVVFLIAGIWLLYLERKLIVKGFASYWWPRVKAVVEDQIDESFWITGYAYPGFGSGKVYYPCKGYPYRYKVGDHTYHSTTYCYGGYLDRSQATFTVGQHITISYNPVDPRDSVIKYGLMPGALIGLVPIILAVIGVVMTIILNAP